MYEFMVQNSNECVGHALVAANMNRAPIKPRRGKPEQTLEALGKNLRVPDVDVDLSFGPKIQERSQEIVGILQFLESSLFEMPRPTQPGRFVEIHVLIEREMKRVTPLEFPVCARVADRERFGSHE